MVPVKKPFLTDVQYDRLKWIVQKLLPALGVLYATLALLWELPYSTEVVGSTAGVALFGGTLLGINQKRFEDDTDGDMEVKVDPDGNVQPFLALDTAPAKFPDKKQLRFNVKQVEEFSKKTPPVEH